MVDNHAFVPEAPLHVGIVGAAGYAGAELAALLLDHPAARLALLAGSGRADAARRLEEAHPRFAGRGDIAIESLSLDRAATLDAILLATPAEASAELAPALLERGVVVLDLSGAHRLDGAAHRLHYAVARDESRAVAAAYGLPERHRAAIASADLVAVPGCYPTASILAFAPLVDAGLVAEDRPIVIDATSGVSGAGRGASERTHFCHVAQQAYAVLGHRHEPEIVRHGGHDAIFTAHLGPYVRGILATVHVPLRDDAAVARVRETLAGACADEPFLRLLPEGAWPTVAAVERTNRCDLQVAVDPRRRHAVVVAAIDNLVKGAAGQAIQCLNLRFGLPETLGLPGAAAPQEAPVPC